VSSLFSLHPLLEREKSNKVYGVVVAVVTDNKNPDGEYMVKVRYPWLSNGDASGQNSEQSGWCRIATFGAGKDRGMYVLPEVGDEVLVAFEHGDVDHPFVVGTLWNKDNTVILDNKDGKNNVREFKSRSGHILAFCDDADGKKEKITLQTKAGARMCLDDTDQGKKIELYDSDSNTYLLIDAQNKKITLESKNGDILIKANKKLRLEAETIETESSKETNMKIGTNFKADADKNFTVNGGGEGKVTASSTLTVKGSTVNIN
jgi:uncharacterized protein involved in type VI secretion and phage assembly